MLAEFVRTRRTELGLSLAQLAARTGFTKAHIHDIEKGRSTNPKCDTVVALAAGLQCSAVALFREAAELSDSGTGANDG